jgi:hypothetical protein
MGFNYVALRDGTAHQLLTKFGRPLKVYRRVVGTYDAATGAAIMTEQVLTMNGVVTDYKSSELDGDTIKRGDKRVLLSASGQSKEPLVGDEILIDSVRHMIVNTAHVRPSDTTVMFDCAARSA